MDYIDLIQWPAMAVTVVSAWFIGSQRAYRRMIAFWGFILSNALWVAWGLHAEAYALIVLECVLLGMNARGFKKNFDGQRHS
ncbi:hypothetical protein [Pseudomonas retamae]|uniref:Amino acid transporter n=1 Tax=Pseudomonas retamae TaxID=702110 RepID=A0ABW7DEV6_9PSED